MDRREPGKQAWGEGHSWCEQYHWAESCMECQGWCQSWPAHHQELSHQIGGNRRSLSVCRQKSTAPMMSAQLVVLGKSLQAHCVSYALPKMKSVTKVYPFCPCNKSRMIIVTEDQTQFEKDNWLTQHAGFQKKKWSSQPFWICIDLKSQQQRKKWMHKAQTRIFLGSHKNLPLMGKI